jgi:hypothetical protein
MRIILLFLLVFISNGYSYKIEHENYNVIKSSTLLENRLSDNSDSNMDKRCSLEEYSLKKRENLINIVVGVIIFTSVFFSFIAYVALNYNASSSCACCFSEEYISSDDGSSSDKECSEGGGDSDVWFGDIIGGDGGGD